jgi:hypothetical protein
VVGLAWMTRQLKCAMTYGRDSIIQRFDVNRFPHSSMFFWLVLIPVSGEHEGGKHQQNKNEIPFSEPLMVE